LTHPETGFCYVSLIAAQLLDSHLGGARTLVSSGVWFDDEGVSMEEISIGEFARRSRLSLKALRLYHELGVLVPSRVDQASGYRYYDAAQLDEARLVELGQLQLPLASINELLTCDPADVANTHR